VNRLFVVSNRVGPLNDAATAGGLAVGLGDALRERGGVWFGWSGQTSEEGTLGPLQIKVGGDVQLATVDMTRLDIEDFYSGFANQALWPVFHYRLDLARFERRFSEAYWRINERFAVRLRPLLKTDDVIWVHDYHFIPLGERIRNEGFAGAIGVFRHIPVPPPEIFSALPDADRLMSSMLAYDVIGFQTATDRDNFVRYLKSHLGAIKLSDGAVIAKGRRIRAEVFPIGIDAERFAGFARTMEARGRLAQIRSRLHDRKLIIGVDRLDYSKGIPERFRAFQHLLENDPEARNSVSLLQVAPVSRSEVSAYAALRRQLEELAGHINGAHGQLDWTPIQIMTRGFTRKGLAGLYRASHVALVTPLRDGMNLVAKEYIAAQDPENPGVLILSRFAGAAQELREALIVNPYDVAEVAETLRRALHMPLAERKDRWRALDETVRSVSAHRWSTDFLAALEGGTQSPKRLGATALQLEVARGAVVPLRPKRRS
jgi:trehalose 6-phosphate synthase